MRGGGYFSRIFVLFLLFLEQSYTVHWITKLDLGGIMSRELRHLAGAFNAAEALVSQRGRWKVQQRAAQWWRNICQPSLSVLRTIPQKILNSSFDCTLITLFEHRLCTFRYFLWFCSCLRVTVDLVKIKCSYNFWSN